jgi:hypothetical protein
MWWRFHILDAEYNKYNINNNFARDFDVFARDFDVFASNVNNFKSKLATDYVVLRRLGRSSFKSTID